MPAKKKIKENTRGQKATNQKPSATYLMDHFTSFEDNILEDKRTIRP